MYFARLGVLCVSIRFVDRHRKHVFAPQSANATRYWYERAVNSGMARLHDLANLPMVAPAVAFGIGKRKGASRHTFLATQGSEAAAISTTTAAPKLGESRPDEDMTSKHYLVTAIASIKRRQEALGEQVPELERQLESLRAAQKQMDTERQALETALATIDGDASVRIQGPDGLPIAGD